MSHVFISYKRDDRSFVTELESRIRAAGLDVWTDQHIRPGENWEFSIDDALKNAFVVIVVITPTSRSSEYVTYEWSFAMGMGIPILPLMLVQTEFHPKLHRIQYLNFTVRYGEPWDDLLKRVQDLHGGYVPLHQRRAVDNAINDMVADLRSESAAAQTAAAMALGNIGNSSAVPDLIDALGSQYESSRAAASVALGMIGDNSAVPYLWKTVHALNKPLVKQAAIRALGMFTDASLPNQIGLLLLQRPIPADEGTIITALVSSMQVNTRAKLDARIPREILRYADLKVREYGDAVNRVGIELEQLYKLKNETDDSTPIQIPGVLQRVANDLWGRLKEETEFLLELESGASLLGPEVEEFAQRGIRYFRDMTAESSNLSYRLEKFMMYSE